MASTTLTQSNPTEAQPTGVILTETAAREIKTIIQQQELDADKVRLRVGVKAGGCSGFEYVFAWEPAPRDGDLVFEGPGGARVWVDPRSHRLLDGTTLDYDTNLLSRGFVFQNPQAKSTCGCGTSFTV